MCVAHREHPSGYEVRSLGRRDKINYAVTGEQRTRAHGGPLQTEVASGAGCAPRNADRAHANLALAHLERGAPCAVGPRQRVLWQSVTAVAPSRSLAVPGSQATHTANATNRGDTGRVGQ